MKISSIILYFVIMLRSHVMCSTCKPLDVCSCKLDTGEVISLWEIDDPKKPRFTLNEGAVGSPWRYDYSPCTAFNHNPGCTGTTVCQYDDTHVPPQSYPLGKADAFTTLYDFNNNLQFVYNGGTYEGASRQTQITLICEKTAETPTTTGLTESGFGSITYSFTLTSKHACPKSITTTKSPLTTTIKPTLIPPFHPDEWMFLGLVMSVILLTFLLLVSYIIIGILLCKIFSSKKNYQNF